MIPEIGENQNTINISFPKETVENVIRILIPMCNALFLHGACEIESTGHDIYSSNTVQNISHMVIFNIKEKVEVNNLSAEAAGLISQLVALSLDKNIVRDNSVTNTISPL